MDSMTLLECIAGITAYAIATIAEKYVKTYVPDVWDELNKED